MSSAFLRQLSGPIAAAKEAGRILRAVSALESMGTSKREIEQIIAVIYDIPPDSGWVLINEAQELARHV